MSRNETTVIPAKAGIQPLLRTLDATCHLMDRNSRQIQRCSWSIRSDPPAGTQHSHAECYTRDSTGNAPLAQWIEHWLAEPGVERSSRSRGTNEGHMTAGCRVLVDLPIWQDSALRNPVAWQPCVQLPHCGRRQAPMSRLSAPTGLLHQTALTSCRGRRGRRRSSVRRRVRWRVGSGYQWRGECGSPGFRYQLRSAA